MKVSVDFIDHNLLDDHNNTIIFCRSEIVILCSFQSHCYGTLYLAPKHRENNIDLEEKLNAQGINLIIANLRHVTFSKEVKFYLICRFGDIGRYQIDIEI